MKVPASLRRLFDDQKALSERLQVAVDERMRGTKRARWHYESRVKELTSYALKVESGRFSAPQALEDFFACTLVVANSLEIGEAERLVTENFQLAYRRPPADDRTAKQADAFPFDDLRIYVRLAASPALPPSDLHGVVFEVQVKTFLQHAWSIATHDLLYKSDEASWSKARIAFQVRAMLEHAEISIQEATQLASSASLAKEDERTANVKQGIALVKSQWNPDELPRDLRRLSENITELLRDLQLDVSRLEQILNEGKNSRAGTHPANLSPYATIVQYLFSAERSRMLKLLQSDHPRHQKRKVCIPAEVELPSGVDLALLRNALIVSATR